VLREEGQGLAQDMAVEIVAEVCDDAESDVAHQDRLAVVAEPLEQVEGDHRQGDEDEHPFVSVEENVVHGRLDEVGRRRGGSAHHGHAQHRQDEPRRVRFDEPEES